MTQYFQGIKILSEKQKKHLEKLVIINKGRKPHKNFIKSMRNKGKKASKETKYKISIANKNPSIDIRFKKSLKTFGKNHWNWKGGISRKSFKERIRTCFRYRLWRDDILLRDNYTCQICGKKEDKIEVDHFPETWHKLINKLKIKSFEEALYCEELWNLNNGRILCYKCHQETKWK